VENDLQLRGSYESSQPCSMNQLFVCIVSRYRVLNLYRVHSSLMCMMKAIITKSGSFNWLSAWIYCLYPRTEEITLKIIMSQVWLPKFRTSFHGKPHNISNKFSGESSNFQTCFHGSKRSLHHSRKLTGIPLDLEIQIFCKSRLLREPCFSLPGPYSI